MNLKEIRKKNDLTQQEVADKLSISRMKYNHYELGNAEPSIETLIKLADFYRVTVDELIGHNVPYLINKIDFSNDQLSIVEDIKSLDNNQCQKVKSYIQGLKDGR